MGEALITRRGGGVSKSALQNMPVSKLNLSKGFPFYLVPIGSFATVWINRVFNDGSAIYGDQTGTSIRFVFRNPDGQFVTNFTYQFTNYTPSQNNPKLIIQEDANNYYMFDNNSVVKITTTGTATPVFVIPGMSSASGMFIAVAWIKNGNLYAIDASNKLYCMNLSTGSLIYSVQQTRASWYSPQIILLQEMDNNYFYLKTGNLGGPFLKLDMDSVSASGFTLSEGSNSIFSAVMTMSNDAIYTIDSSKYVHIINKNNLSVISTTAITQTTDFANYSFIFYDDDTNKFYLVGTYNFTEYNLDVTMNEAFPINNSIASHNSANGNVISKKAAILGSYLMYSKVNVNI